MRLSRWAVSSVFFTNGFLYASYISRLPEIQNHYHLDYKGVGFVLLVGSVGSLLAMPFTGSLISRFGSKLVTLTASFMFCLMVAIFMFAPSLLFLLPIFFIKGVAAGITDVAMNAQAVLVERAQSKPIMSAFHGIFSLGMFAGAGAGSIFIYLQTSVWLHLLIAGALGFSYVIIWARFLIKELQVNQPKQKGQRLSFQLPTPALIGIGIISFCAMLAEGAMADWSTNFLQEVLQASSFLAPLGLTAFSLSMLIGRLFGDKARMRFGDATLITLSSTIAIAGLTVVVVAIGIIPTILGFFLVGIGLATIVPIAYSKAGNAPGIEPGTGISMVTTIGYSGFIIGPPVLGLLADRWGLQIAYACVLILLGAMLLLSLRPSASGKTK
jgi:predicted MFS family arabinose efflux permease